MKAAEEWLRDYAKLNRDLPINDFVIGFVKQYAKAKLEEAAERVTKREIQYDAESEYDRASGANQAVQIILNTPLD